MHYKESNAKRTIKYQTPNSKRNQTPSALYGIKYAMHNGIKHLTQMRGNQSFKGKCCKDKRIFFASLKASA